MSYAPLRQVVFEANMALASSGLIMGTYGNLSVADHERGVIAIKPSGIPYETLTPETMVVVSLADGAVLESDLRPSSDTATHLELYRAFRTGAIVHTHSEFATTFAQARTPIRCMGTTHADYFRGDIPVTRAMHEDEVAHDYELNTGRVIVETFATLSPDDVPAVLVANHGPFVWGPDAWRAIEHAKVLEFLARLDWRVRTMWPEAPRPDRHLVDKHYQRKHGPSAYYGQK